MVCIMRAGCAPGHPGNPGCNKAATRYDGGMAKEALRLSPTDRRELDALERLCRSRLPRPALMRSLAERLSRYTGAESYCFSLLDPGSGLPTEAVSKLEDGARRAWAERVFLRSPLGNMGWLTRQPHLIQLAEQFVAEPDHDPLFRYVLLPSGLGPMLCLSLAARGFGWGYLNLMWPSGAARFGEEEKRFLAAAAPIMTEALRRSAALAFLSALPADSVGLITFAPDGSIEAANEVGYALMAGEGGSCSIPLTVALMGQLLRRAMADDTPLPVCSLPIVDAVAQRRYRIRPELLRGRDGRARGVVVIEPLRALDDASVLIQLGLTRREADVVVATVKGLSTQDAAAVLGVSPHTIEHHLGNVFSKLAVGSRSEMTALLLGSRSGRASEAPRGTSSADRPRSRLQ